MDWWYFPRVWFKYVDDFFAVFDTKAISLDNFVAKLNNRFPTIKLTYEMEHNEQLPFLDVLVIRNSENKLEFDVYRKETVTLRYIPNDSHHPSHKMASFNFLIHRLLNFLLSKEERKTIEDDPRPGRPSTSKTDENIENIGKLIREDHLLSIRGLAEIIEIDEECVRQIWHESFNMRKNGAKTPHFRAKGIKNEHFR
ncbi:hypothetical protein NQ318_021312 [Aromia moschata]|uniref:Uncharacterized protein n=1 Tax=Aromia moschata TaxID=1265417 RepID=A0AAV8ZBG2_9CUCU|nr:hypothetical protein NQ318_021312 [Aromia moschata]